MKSFKELIKNKNYFTFLLSLFIFISGVLILLLGLAMFFTVNTSTTDKTIPIGIIIFGTIVAFFGYMIPKLILISKNIAENEKEECNNEKKNVIQNISGIRLATDTEKQDYIVNKKIKKDINFPTLLIISMSLFLGFIFILVGLAKEEAKAFLLPLGIFAIVIGIISFYRQKNKNINMIKKIMNSDIYIANCYVYDRKTERIKNITYNGERSRRNIYTVYLIKITDGNYCIDKWFPIDYKVYHNETIRVKLYVSDEIDIYDIIADET